MTRICLIALAVVLYLSSAAASFAQDRHFRMSRSSVEAVNRYLDKLDRVGFNGVVLVGANGKPVVSRGFGFSDAERKVRNSPGTIFDIGSVAKQFTAAAIMKLEMQGKLSTGDKIGKYFGNVPPDKAGITIHDLLRHSAGLPSVVGGDFDRISEADFVSKVMTTPLKFPAGERFGYSNVGYSLLALIVEKVSGQSYERYLYENLWKPAGMETTGYTRPKFDTNRIAVGYRKDERWGRPTDKLWDTDAPFLHLKGNGGILSTAEDLFKWDRALSTDKILSESAKAKYYHPQLRADEAGMSFYYGYGWDIRKLGGNRTRARHNGTNRVFYADFYRFLEDGVSVVLLTNKSLSNSDDTAMVISRMIFEPGFEPAAPVPDNAANRAFTDEMIKLTQEKGFAAASESYRNRNKEIELLESVVNQKAYDAMEQKKLPEALDLFKLNAHAFPKSANAFDSLGEAYLESGDKAAALENYRKSLQLNPENEYARNVIKRLEGK